MLSSLSLCKLGLQLALTIFNVLSWVVPLRIRSLRENKDVLSLCNAFSGGIFLCLALSHLLPHALDKIAHSNVDIGTRDGEDGLGGEGGGDGSSAVPTPQAVALASEGAAGSPNLLLPFYGALAGYLLIFFIDHIAFNSKEFLSGSAEKSDAAADEKEQSTRGGGNKTGEAPVDTPRSTSSTISVSSTSSTGKGRSTPAVALLALGTHSLLETMALGLADSQEEAVLLATSIGLHQPAESIALLIAFLKSGLSEESVSKWLSLFSCVSFLGVTAGLIVNTMAAPLVDGMLVSVAAGSFIYVGATEIVTEEFDDNCSQRDKVRKFIALCAGILTIIVLTSATSLMPSGTDNGSGAETDVAPGLFGHTPSSASGTDAEL